MKYLFLTVICVLILGCEEELPSATAPIESRVELAAGDVWLVEDDGPKRLITGVMLKEGARLRVGDGSRALVRLSNGTRVFFRGGTEAVLDSGSLQVSKGEVFADVAESEGTLVRFTARDVTVSAEGAGFNLALGADEVRLYVVRGLAVFSSKGGRVEVEKGEMGTSKKGAKPTVAPVAFFDDWTGGMADRELDANLGGRGAGQIYGIDRTRPGSPPQTLQITKQSIRTVIRDGIAHTTVDQRFFNPGSDILEGWYWFTIPEDASVERFALEVNGALVEGEMIERKQAAEAYEEAIRRAVDPALLEWVDGRSFRARIYPIPGVGERRVVLSYTEILPLVDNVYRYIYPMGSGGAAEIGEFSLTVDLGDEGREIDIATLQDARIEDGGRRVTMRRSGYTPHSDFLLELRKAEVAEPMRIARFSPGEEAADYIMIRYSPDVAWNEVKDVRGDVVVVLDTSAGGDASDRQIRLDAAEAILRALSASDRFAVVTTDLSSRVVYPEKGLAPAEEAHVARAVERLSEVPSGGATDLGEMFHAALNLVHDSPQPAVVYIGDGKATTGEIANEELASRLRRSLGNSRARLFTMAVGEDARYGLLSRLSRVGGGQSFRIDTPEETVTRALGFVGAVKTPTLTDLAIDAGAGLDQVFMTASKKISEGGEVVLLARTHHALPDQITVKGRLGQKVVEKTYDTRVASGDENAYIANLWARLYLQNLFGDGVEENRGLIISLGLQYALMTPLTSFLVLDSDEAYEAQGIKRRNRRIWSARGERSEARPWLPKRANEAIIGGPLSLVGCSDPETRTMTEQDEVPEWLKRGRREEAQGGKGKRHKGEEGQMGQRDAVKTDNHYGIKGPADNPSPHMARSQAKEMAKSEGVLSYLSASDKPASPFGSPAPEASLGQTGLGLRGTGRGGGGTGEGTIGLGNLNTIGHGGGGGSGSGYGRGAGGLGGRQGKAPKIRSGKTVVRGSLSKEVIRRIVHRHINEVKFCYERELVKRPDLAGRVSTKFIINGTGAVQMAAVANSTLGSAAVENCIAQAVRRWTFPAPEGGGVVIVTYPFQLTGPDGKLPPEPKAEPESAPEPPKFQIATQTAICSDASSRPLHERRVVWSRRIARADTAEKLVSVYSAAKQRCELKGWRDTRVMLNLIESRVRTAVDVTALLGAFDQRPQLREYLRKRILRRAFDPDVVFSLYRGGGIDWNSAMQGIAALKTIEERVAALKKLLEAHPQDPIGRTLLAKTLFEAGRNDEALAVAVRLKRDGLTTPSVLEILCDLQADAGRDQEARRSCSELVEFNESDAAARLRLGNLFLRHGWYDAAYRQFKTLADMTEETPLALLKLARAAAGMGRIDEALRMERKVAAGEGEPGPNDVRQWAKLHSVALLADMILDARTKGDKEKVRTLERALKRTQILSERAVLKIAVWEDEGANLALTVKSGTETLPISQRVSAAPLGLHMIDLGPEAPGTAVYSVVQDGAPLFRAVEFTVYTIRFDGKSYTVEKTAGELAPKREAVEIHSA